MKRILLLAAGALGTAGMIAMAAPASADAPANSGDSLQSQAGKFRDSIDPEKAVNAFLNGNCGANLDRCPPEGREPRRLAPVRLFPTEPAEPVKGVHRQRRPVEATRQVRQEHHRGAQLRPGRQEALMKKALIGGIVAVAIGLTAI